MHSSDQNNPGISYLHEPDFTVGIRLDDGVVAIVANSNGEAESRLAEWFAHEPTRPLPSSAAYRPEAEATYLTLMVAQRCNLRCTYCYGGDGEYGAAGILERDVAFSAISSFLSQEGSPARNINFFGGEPLLALPLVRESVTYALRESIARNRDVSFSMTTNATLVTEQTAAWLASLPFSVVVSIDGDAEMHGQNRPDASGRSSWAKTVAGARALLERLGPDRVRARATLTTGYPDIEDIVGCLTNLGFTNISVTPVETTHLGDVQAWSGADHTRYRDGVSTLDPNESAWKPYKDITHLLVTGQRQSLPCGAGSSARAVSSDGVLYPCHRFVGDSRFAVGLARGARVDPSSAGFRRFEAARSQIATTCASCYARTFCAGGCTHVAVERMDQGLAPLDKDNCDSIRWQVRTAIQRVAAAHPVPRSPQVIGPEYLRTPPTLAEYRRAVITVTASDNQARTPWHDLEDEVTAAYRHALAPLSQWYRDHELEPEEIERIDRHDWLTLSFCRTLLNSGEIPPTHDDLASAAGWALAWVGCLQALGALHDDRESLRLAWAAAYGSTLNALSQGDHGPALSRLSAELGQTYLAARVAEERWGDSGIPADWPAVTRAKHRPLAFPAMAMAICAGQPELAAALAEFAELSGPCRQLVDDYEDVMQDRSLGRVNWWAIRLPELLGPLRNDWATVLASRTAETLVSRAIESDPFSKHDFHRPWELRARTIYLNELRARVKRARQRWEKMPGGVGSP